MKNKIIKYVLVFLGTLIAAFNFNYILLPNNIVIGGFSGVAQIFNKLLDITPIFTILIITSLNIFIILTKEEKINLVEVIINAYLFPVLILFTGLFEKYIHFNLHDNILLVLISAALTGISSALVFKAGFEVDGSNMGPNRLKLKKHASPGNSVFYTNIIIVLLSGLIFGFRKAIYGFIIIALKSIIIDRLILGISDSKLFLIYTKKIKEMKNMILKEMNTGVTIFNVEGGFSKKKTKMIMCVVNTKDYFAFKNRVLEIDENAFITINDCFEARGGIKKNKLPFN